MRSGNKPSFTSMGSSPITEKIDWSQAPGVGTQERIDWYKKHNLALDDTTKLKDTPKENKNQDTNTDNNENVKADPNVEKSTEQPEISKGAMIGNILAASLTGGLDAVYGTGKVLPPGTKLEYKTDKGKKDDETGEERVDKLIGE